MQAPDGVFPEPMTEDVYRLGYNAASAAGAHSFLIRRKAGNAMVDAPRWTRAVVGSLEEWGGLSDILLTHRDDIGDAQHYAKHFGACGFITGQGGAVRGPYWQGREPVALGSDPWRSPFRGTQGKRCVSV
jgi:hypothetical protein